MIAVVIRTGVAGAPIDEVQLGVVAAGDPGGGAARLPTVAGPRLVGGLAFAGDRPEAPELLAGLGVVGVEEAADAVLAAGDADDDLVPDGQRRARRRVAVARVRHLRLPAQRAR